MEKLTPALLISLKVFKLAALSVSLVSMEKLSESKCGAQFVGGGSKTTLTQGSVNRKSEPEKKQLQTKAGDCRQFLVWRPCPPLAPGPSGPSGHPLTLTGDVQETTNWSKVAACSSELNICLLHQSNFMKYLVHQLLLESDSDHFKQREKLVYYIVNLWVGLFSQINFFYDIFAQ